MITLRVDISRKCNCCGTELVADLFDRSMDAHVCPWCGSNFTPDSGISGDELRKLVSGALREIEEKANRPAVL